MKIINLLLVDLHNKAGWLKLYSYLLQRTREADALLVKSWESLSLSLSPSATYRRPLSSSTGAGADSALRSRASQQQWWMGECLLFNLSIQIPIVILGIQTGDFNLSVRDAFLNLL